MEHSGSSANSGRQGEQTAAVSSVLPEEQCSVAGRVSPSPLRLSFPYGRPPRREVAVVGQPAHTRRHIYLLILAEASLRCADGGWRPRRSHASDTCACGVVDVAAQCGVVAHGASDARTTCSLPCGTAGHGNQAHFTYQDNTTFYQPSKC